MKPSIPTTRTTTSSEVALIAEGLNDDDSSRGICPKCKGGQSKEHSFSISRGKGGLCFYYCFRATCNYSGTLLLGTRNGTGQATYGGKTARARTTRIFTRPIEEVTDDQVLWFESQFGFRPSIDVLWCPSLERYAWRVFGPQGQNRGWVLRSYCDTPGPKSLAYPHRDEPFISWSFPEGGGPKFGGTVIVEDLASARKVSDAGITAVALLGTHIDYERAYEIRKYSDGPIHLALDRGTMGLMVKYRAKFASVWGHCTIWQLDKDLKFVSRTRIREAIENGFTDFISLPDEG
jgi:hypothetical protein